MFVNNDDFNYGEGKITRVPSYVLDHYEFGATITVRVRAGTKHYWSDVLGPQSITIFRKSIRFFSNLYKLEKIG